MMTKLSLGSLLHTSSLCHRFPHPVDFLQPRVYPLEPDLEVRELNSTHKCEDTNLFSLFRGKILVPSIHITK